MIGRGWCQAMGQPGAVCTEALAWAPTCCQPLTRPFLALLWGAPGCLGHVCPGFATLLVTHGVKKGTALRVTQLAHGLGGPGWHMRVVGLGLFLAGWVGLGVEVEAWGRWRWCSLRLQIRKVEGMDESLSFLSD